MNAQLENHTRIDGRWDLQRPVGKGGMGTVYRAIDITSAEAVAIKMLDGDGDHHDERFLREIKALAELRHPSIVAYLAHGRTADLQPFLVMEWLDGEDLSSRLKRKDSLSVGQILDIAIHVAEALEFAHSRGVVHRDIKPANIFLHRGTMTKVLDFGIARKVGAETLTQTGAIVGTIAYMPPELIRSSRETEPRTDIYSLGCVLYECLSGEPPFSGNVVAAILAKIIFEEPRPLDAINPQLPRDLVDLVHAMLRKEVNERPSAVAELLRDIQRRIDNTLFPPENRAGVVIAKAVMTHGELRMMTAVLASPNVDALLPITRSDSLYLTPTSEVQGNGHTLEIGISAGQYPGVRISELADGWVLAVFERVAQVGLVEQVFHAAQLARDIQQNRPNAQIVISVSHVGGTRPTMGPLVETCARMLERINSTVQLTSKPVGIWLDDVSAGMLADRFDIEKSAFGIRLCDRRITNNSPFLFLGKPNQCVGRDTELSTLDLWVNSSFDDSVARAVLLVALPGLGKTRLLYEFFQRLEKRELRYLRLTGRCDPLSESSPYGPLQEALRHHFGVQSGQTETFQRQTLQDAISQRMTGNEASRVVEFLGELIGVPFPAQESPQLAAARHDPKLMSDQITQALTDFLAAECAVQPVLLVIEDLQFSDSLTIRIIESLLNDLKEQPFVALAAARPDVLDKFPQLWTSVQKDVLQLRGLNKKSSERLVIQMLGANTPSALVEKIVQLADGNALFLEELIRTVSGGQSEMLPVTILAVLQQRVQALPSDARRILRAASIFGQAFWKGGITELTGLSESDVEDWLLFLSRAEVLERRRHSRFANESEFAFRHGLMCGAVSRMVTDEDRQVGHGLAAKYLVHVGEQDAFVLASHFEHGGNLLEAGKYNVRGAAECLARYDGAGARKGAHRAIEQGVEGETRGMACSVLAQALYWGVEWEPVPKWASEALSLCAAGSTEYCRSLSVFIMTVVMSGQHEHIGPLVGTFLTTEPKPEAVEAYVEAGNFIVLMFVMIAERALVETLIARLGQVVAEAAEISLSRAMLSFCHGAYLRLMSSQPWRAVELLRDAHTRFHRAGDIRNEALAACLAALAEREIGNFETGEKILDDAIQLAERIAGTMVPTVQMHQALLYEHATEASAQQKAFDLAQKVVDGFGVNAVYVALAQGIVARGLLHHGKANEAVALAEQAKLALQQTPTMQAIVVPTLVDALTRAERLDDAVQAARDLITLYAKLGDAGYLEPIGRLSAASALSAAGHTEEAAALRTLAKTHIERRAENAPNEEARQCFVSLLPENNRAFLGA